MILKKRACLAPFFLLFFILINVLQGSICSPDTLKSTLVTLSNTVISDSLELGCSLFSADSFKMAAAFVPFYCIARKWDEPVHCCFYNKKQHKNIRQLPGWCHSGANVGVIAVPMISLGACAVFAQDLKLRTTAQVFVLGLPVTWATKRVLKLFKAECCLRPRNQHFPRFPRTHGGFPSGHMLEISYMTTLLGLQYGPRLAIPLTLGAGFLAVDFTVCNRHYVSQLVAGTALGVMFGVAASKLVDTKLARNAFLGALNVTVTNCSETDRPAVQVAYSF